MSTLKRLVTTAATLAAMTTAAAAQTGAGADLRTTLNTTLAEHVYLAAAATGAALGGRAAEFTDAAGSLDANSVTLARAIGQVYGPEAEGAFLALWRRHIDFFVDYTTGVAKQDRAMQDEAATALVGYAVDFGAFLSSANPNLPKDVVADLVRSHVVSLREVVDAQARQDWAGAYARLRDAAAHMRMIADPLAGAIVKQFPEKFAMR